MGKVHIILEKGETQEEIESDLFKALSLHASGDIHDKEEFKDPAMNAVVHKMELDHKKIYEEMLEEISKELDKDYRANGN